MKKRMIAIAALMTLAGTASSPIKLALADQQTFTFEVTCKGKDGFSQNFCQSVSASGSGKATDIVQAQYPQCRVQSVTYCRH